MTPEEKKAQDGICRHFRTSMRRIEADNMPVLVRWGTRAVFPALFADIGFTKGVEIGTYYGAYAIALCEQNPNLRLTTVDPYIAYGGRDQAKQEMIKAKMYENIKPYNITVLEMTSIEALSHFEDESLDFVFIDGNHDFDNVAVDLIFWNHKVRYGGMIVLHDYMAGHGAGVMKVIDGYTHCHDIRPWFVTREREATAFWVKQRKPRYDVKLSPLGRTY